MTKKMWIEDINSIKEKLQLIKNNELAGVAAWAKDMEDGNVWTVLKTELDIK